MLIRKAEKFLLTQLNDPDSYKRESFIITEIVTESDIPIKLRERSIQSTEKIIDLINVALSNAESAEKKDVNIEKEIVRYKTQIDSFNIIKKSELAVIDSLKRFKTNNSTKFCVYFLATYRSKNGYGGYLRQVTKIRYFYNSNKFEIPDENEIVGY